MQPFTTLTSTAVSLPQGDIDTDIIFPARFLLYTDKKGLGRFAFYEWRYEPDGTQRPEFVLNQASARGAEILVAGPNFGCGSSREHAPWSILDLGFRCIIATSFGEIFQSNCMKNGMLPVVLPAEQVAQFRAAAEAGQTITVDLQNQTATAPGISATFQVDPAAREPLLNGWNETATILNRDGAAIAAFEAAEKAKMPWLYAS